MSTSTITRRTAAVLLTAGLLFGVVACGSSDSSDGAKAPGTTAPGDTSAGAGSDDTTAPDGGGGKTDPCQWYTAAEMEAILGFPVTMEAQTAGADEKCVYDAPDNYSSVEITPSDDVTYDTQKNFAESADGVKLAGEVKTYDGLGDGAYGHESKGGVDIDAVKGSKSVQVLITNGGGGDGAGNVSTPEGTLEIAKQIVTKALG
ncbi:hypothetical protein BH10ACT1_BH10ACT1_40050 [soil metagenome]